MKICVAQTKPVKADIAANITAHKKMIEAAVMNGAEMIIFPELSITGYEPELADELATNQDDKRFDVFQELSDTGKIVIGVGMSIKNGNGICIGMILFQPKKERQIYIKKYLHADEEPFFNSGQSFVSVVIKETTVAPAICYELSIPEHSETAFKSGAEIYMVSVAKSEGGITNAYKTLATLAQTYAMTVLMSNCLGHCDNFESAGKTAIWNKAGQLIGQLDDVSEGILAYDTETQDITNFKL